MTIKYEELVYTIPNDGTGNHGAHADVIFQYDDATLAGDGSVIVTGASGTYETLDQHGDVSNTDAITGVEPTGSFGGNDNKLFIDSSPHLDGSGITYTLDNLADGNNDAGDINVFEGTGDPTYAEAGHNHEAATSFTLEEAEGPAPACYLAGTRILTPDGEVAIEALRIGGLVVTASGAARAIKWIGRRGHAATAKYLPICIAAGALGENIPHRDLQVSPRHAMLLDGLLIEARWLLNGATITQPARAEDIQYFHIELDSHDVLMAEGAASESFQGATKRHRFDNGAEFAALYPGEFPNPFARPCAPRAADGFAFQAVRDRLAPRAARAA